MRRGATFVLLSALAALSGCEKKAPAAAPVAPPPVTAEITVSDQLAAFDTPINAVAFWTHPKIPFNGLALVATDKALVALNIEDGAEVARIDGIAAKGVSVAYTGYGADAWGYAAVETGGQSAAIALYAIDNVSRTLTPVAMTPIPVASGDRGFCIGRDEAGKGLLLHIMRADGWSTIPIAIASDGASVGGRKSAAFGGGLLSCAADDLDTSFFATAPGGAVVHVDKNGVAGGAPFARTPMSAPAGLGIVLNGLIEGGPTDECCGEALVLDGETGGVYVFDHDDGKPLGLVTIKASFDVDGVAKATAIGVGTGNFGGVYRDGVVAIGTAGEKPAVRLVPVNSVLDALGVKFGEAADRRMLNPHDEEETGFPINIPPPQHP